MDVEFGNLLVVVAVAFAAPLLLGLAPALRLPAVVLEIVAGIAVGPSGLGWVEVDEAVQVLAVIGLAMLLFLAGLEIELHSIRGPLLRASLVGFVVSFGLAVLIAFGLELGGLVSDPLFVAVVLSATSLGIVVPVLKDAGEVGSMFGQLVIAAATIADFATIILLSLLFSRESASTGSQVALIVVMLATVALVAIAIAGVERLGAVSRTLRRLQDTTAQIRIRGAFLLLIGLVALATELGLEVILGAFLAGAIVSLVDRDESMTHPSLRPKLDAVGYGVFIPVFFVSSGIEFDLGALADTETLVRIPVFLAALAAVRGLPALLYRGLVGARHVPVAALLQATSLPFIVAATAIGRELGVVTSGNQAALIAAGLLSVVLFPTAAVVLLNRGGPARA